MTKEDIIGGLGRFIAMVGLFCSAVSIFHPPVLFAAVLCIVTSAALFGLYYWMTRDADEILRRFTR